MKNTEYFIKEPMTVEEAAEVFHILTPEKRREIKRLIDVLRSGNAEAVSFINNFIDNPPEGAQAKDYRRALEVAEAMLEA